MYLNWLSYFGIWSNQFVNTKTKPYYAWCDGTPGNVYLNWDTYIKSMEV